MHKSLWGSIVYKTVFSVIAGFCLFLGKPIGSAIEDNSFLYNPNLNPNGINKELIDIKSIALEAVSYLNALRELPQKYSPPIKYKRSYFGTSWTDDNYSEFGHNGCQTRDDILRRDLTRITVRSNGCTIQSGILEDVYTSKTIVFRRGRDSSQAIQIDHVVSLKDAWINGAWKWYDDDKFDRLIAYANDPRHLWAVDGIQNQKHSDSSFSAWVPPNKSIRCIYAAVQIRIKYIYNLAVRPAERQAMLRTLSGCIN